VTLLRSDHRISDFIEAVKGVLLPGAHTLVCKLCLHVACHVIAVTAELQTNVAPACPELNVIAAFHIAEAQSASLT
jgi:hypothetical protein